MMSHKSEHAQKLAVIDAQLEILRRREAEFQRVIEEMQLLQTSVRREREELVTLREELDHLRIPIYRMPAEILIQIFLLAISSEFEDQRPLGRAWPLWTPFNLSHVCHSWYKAITSTPEMWSFIALNGALRQYPVLQEHFRRSLASPLHICYRVSSDISKEDDLRQIKDIMSELEEHFCRIRTFDFQTRTFRAMECCLEGLKKFISTSTTRAIETLSLIITGESSLDFGLGSTYVTGKYSVPDEFQMPCRIRALKSSHLIPFPLPPQIFADLTRLELSFAPRKSLAVNVPHLRASTLVRFLSHTPRLEHLVLFDTIPIFDTTNTDTKVPLLHLRTLDWSNPQVRDVTRLMSFFHIPSLIKFDLWLDGPQQSTFLGSPPSFTAHPFSTTSCVLEYSSLKDLNLQCLGDSDSVKYVFGKFLFPVLERLEIANFAAGSKGTGDEGQQLLPLPALTDIFRDPRLSSLTHLTLCSWNIPSDLGFTRAFLGYLPTLTSLTLEKCLNVGTLIQTLQELVLVRFMSKAMPQQRRDVKVCPKLEALTLWGCNDVESACLRGLVLARNRNIEPTCRVVISPGAKLEPNGVSIAPKLGQAQGNSGRETEPSTKGRVILPLRKTRRQGQSPPLEDLGYTPSTPSAPPRVVSDIDATGNFSQHAHILYLRVEDCKLISQVEAESLKSLGVLDVIWS